MEKKIKVIIDTDNGTDIDDINTLYFALNNNVEIVGIISSYLNTQRRVLQIKKVLELYGRTDIPVFAGCGIPLKPLHGCDLDYVYNQYIPELGEPSSEDYSGEAAIEFLIQKARELKDELVILEIAPETTLASAIKRDRDAFKDCHIQIMGGCFYEDNFEWNIECDYEAARIVLESGLDISYVGLDVCDCTEIKDEKLIKLFYSPNKDIKLDYLTRWVNLWQATEKRGIILYDSITLFTIFDKNLCTFKDEKVAFELRDDNHAYLCLREGGYPVKVANSINIDILYSYVYKLFNKEK